MKEEKKPTIIDCVEELKNFCICGSGKNLYISNRMPLKIVETFIEIMDDEDKLELLCGIETQFTFTGQEKIPVNDIEAYFMK